MLDITSDPNIYNHKLSTSLMQYNTLYSAISPYGEATPNRAGVDFLFDYKNDEGSILAVADMAFFQEIIGQGTEEKRSMLSSGLSFTAHIDKITGLKKKQCLRHL